MNENGISNPIAKLIEQGGAVQRIENETQMQMALQRPRDIILIREKVLKELEAFPEFAAKAYYVIPFRNEHGGITNVEGPSIHAAMSIARAWGNCATGGRVIGETDDRIAVEGVFLDYETNMRTVRTISVARTAWDKKIQKVVPLREDRLTREIQAGISKAIRNAILASMPVSLVDAHFKLAKELVGRGAAKPKEILTQKAFKKRVDMMYVSFEKLGVARQQVENFIGKRDLNEELIGEMVGIYNAIKDNQASVDDIFNIQNGADKKQEKEQVTLDSLTGEKDEK